MLYNYHTHSTYCDGKNTPEEMVQKAIELGLCELGFSGHSYTSFDLEPCMSVEGTKQYKKEITALKQKYKDKIKILLGIEYDYYSNELTDAYDYVIGSVHYLKKGENYLCIDNGRDLQIDISNKYYDGDFYALIEDYYATVADIYNKTKCDVIGHFDIITKYNDDGSLFDPRHPRYIAAWKSAADAIIKTPAVVEINTGPLARGHKSTPYPSLEIIEYFKQNGKKLIFSSDCHNKDFLLFGYDNIKRYL